MRGDNAIAQLAIAVAKVDAHQFPVQLNEVTRAYFAAMGKLTPGATGDALTAISANPNDPAALAIVTRDPSWNGILRTTCVPTLIKGGHAENALPQHAEANINCRIFPADSIDYVKQTLIDVIGDPKIALTTAGSIGLNPPVPQLSEQIMAPVRRAAAQVYPGIPIVPAMTTGATDGRYLSIGGIPTYGLTGIFNDPDGDGVHGLNERIRVKSLYDGRDFLYAVVKDASMAK